jgi:hypothetical protein
LTKTKLMSPQSLTIWTAFTETWHSRQCWRNTTASTIWIYPFTEFPVTSSLTYTESPPKQTRPFTSRLPTHYSKNWQSTIFTLIGCCLYQSWTTLNSMNGM